MATCPCKCGRRVGRSARKTANRAVEIGIMLPIVERSYEILRDRPREEILVDLEVEHSLAETGRGYHDAMLASAHGEPWPDAPPGRRELRDWERRASLRFALAETGDAQWLKDYLGSLPLKQRLLLRLMLLTGRATLR